MAESADRSEYPRSDHFDGRKFSNLDTQVNKTLFDVLKWQLQKKQEKWPDWVNDNETPQLLTSVPEHQAALTFVNHATVLIQLPGLNLLTDPLYGKRTSPLSWAGPARHRAPGVDFDKLPFIHVVFVSHNHYDHLDEETLRRLIVKFDPLFVTPLGNQKYLRKLGSQKVIELDWGQKTNLPGESTLHLVPVQHWSARTMFDRNEALWGGFVLQAQGLNLYFGGDSGYGPHYKSTFQNFGPMDVSFLPIGAYEPRWFMKEQHLNPVEAAQAHLDLHSRFSVGIHFGTFQLTDEGINRPLEDLQAGLEQAGLDPTRFRAPRNGTTFFYSQAKGLRSAL